MANMYPKNIAEYLPEDSEKVVYYALKSQLPETFDVFYSVKWTTYEKGQCIQSEADFIVASPEYGFLCLEVKGGNDIVIDEDNHWTLIDHTNGDRHLSCSPYDQAEKSMYYFEKVYTNTNHISYPGIYAAGVVFPFYAVPQHKLIDHRHRDCTIDCSEMNQLYDKIKKMFRIWAGTSYGFRVYRENQHKALLELIRQKVALSAAAGALVQYKEHQLQVINRVQDNYVYLLSNVTQFYMKGGAGTGKTWIAKKMAMQEAEKHNRQVLFLCTSPTLRDTVKKDISLNPLIADKVDVYCISQLFQKISVDFESYEAPLYEGIEKSIDANMKYDAIFVDEAQDFTEEWARITRSLLADQSKSRLGIFYDDVQIFREDSFGNGFGIVGEPYLLRENIRNTANIYSWTAEKTNLGKDVVVNPVEGPTPVTEMIYDHLQLTHRLEMLLKKYIDEEHLANDKIVVLVDDVEAFSAEYPEGIAKWKFTKRDLSSASEIKMSSVEEFKGLESVMVIYIHSETVTPNMNYIAYTRAKYYLIELIRR